MHTRPWRLVLAAATTMMLVAACSPGDESTTGESVAPATTSCASKGDLTMLA